MSKEKAEHHYIGLFAILAVVAIMAIILALADIIPATYQPSTNMGGRAVVVKQSMVENPVFGQAITAAVFLNGVMVSDSDNMLVAFIGPEEVGSGHPVYIPVTADYIFEFMVYGDIYSVGEQVNLALLDAKTDKLCFAKENIIFTPNDYTGTSKNPLVLEIIC